MINVEVKTQQVKIKLEKLSKNLDSEIILFSVQQGALFYLGELKKESPVDTGKLRASIVNEYEVQKTGIATRIVSHTGTPLSYGPKVESGMPPHNPPYYPIKSWSSRKGLPVGAIIGAIRRQGTKPNPFFSRTFLKHREKVILLVKEQLFLQLGRIT